MLIAEEIGQIISSAMTKQLLIVEFANEETARFRARQISARLATVINTSRSLNVESFGRRIILRVN